MKNLTFLLTILILGCRPNSITTNLKPIAGHPNILYILADDLGYGDLQVYNPDSRIPTPHIDRLAGQGIRFTDAHAPSSVCTPTRYALLTGQYCWRSRLPVGVLRGFGRSLIAKEQLTVAELLKSNGYTTGVVGKWHLGLDWAIRQGMQQVLDTLTTHRSPLGHITEMDPSYLDFNKKPANGPLVHGFDYSFILPASLDMPPYCYLENDSLTSLPTASTPGSDLNTGYTGAFWRPGLMAPDFEFHQVLPTFIEKATQFIKKQATTSQPFFLYLPLAAPHTPWVPTGEYSGKSRAGTYGDFVNMVDESVGQILETLDNLNLSNNTLVIFASDNGPFWKPDAMEQYGHRAAGPWRGMKADAWEGGHRIPFIARYPGKIKAGTLTTALTTLANLPATCADLLGVDLPDGQGQDSRSIWPVLTGEADHAVGQEAVVHHSSRGYFAVRKGDWKLIDGLGSGGFSEPAVIESEPGKPNGQLYNLKDDPQESRNVYAEFPEIVRELQGVLQRIKGF